jgi:aryl-alcohol dehydrogenase-like predicted oxidoreductase
MSTREQLERNLRALDFKVDPDLLAKIAQIVAPVKDKSWPSGIQQQHA